MPRRSCARPRPISTASASSRPDPRYAHRRFCAGKPNGPSSTSGCRAKSSKPKRGSPSPAGPPPLPAPTGARHEAAEAENEVERARGAVAAATSERGELDAALRIARTALADRGRRTFGARHAADRPRRKAGGGGERLADLERQQNRLEQDRDDADRTTRDAATALETIDADLDRAEAEAASENDGRPALECALEAAEDEANKAQIDLARLAAANAAVEADWQVAEAAMHQTAERVARLEADRGPAAFDPGRVGRRFRSAAHARGRPKGRLPTQRHDLKKHGSA